MGREAGQGGLPGLPPHTRMNHPMNQWETRDAVPTAAFHLKTSGPTAGRQTLFIWGGLTTPTPASPCPGAKVLKSTVSLDQIQLLALVCVYVCVFKTKL